jgi:putative colanic acid biosynthesis UDP-glucose lipid carrier transferase
MEAVMTELSLRDTRPLWFRAAKRVFDVCAATTALLLLAPLMVIVADGIQKDGPGPVLFRQWREGYQGRAFRIFKFRSMSCDQPGGFRQARRRDPRVTRIGSFLRSSSIDELPQLLNVLWGDMSLVGPRPHVAALSARFAPLIEGYYERLRAKPGITGLAQVSGCRGETETLDKMAARIAFDRDYVARPSLTADVMICVRTLRTSLGDDDAY